VTQTVDNGRLMNARMPGRCAECGQPIAAGDKIYFQREKGSRHAACVDGGCAAEQPEQLSPSRNPRADLEREDAERSPAKNVYRELAQREAARKELGKLLDKTIDFLSSLRETLS